MASGSRFALRKLAGVMAVGLSVALPVAALAADRADSSRGSPLDGQDKPGSLAPVSALHDLAFFGCHKIESKELTQTYCFWSNGKTLWTFTSANGLFQYDLNKASYAEKGKAP